MADPSVHVQFEHRDSDRQDCHSFVKAMIKDVNPEIEGVKQNGGRLSWTAVFLMSAASA
jgi:hypothetical protein